MVRFKRRNDLDLEQSPDPELRVEVIRELVDALPEDQQLVLSLLYFGAGSPSMARVQEELELSDYKFKDLHSRAIESLREALLDPDVMGAMLADDDPRVGALLRSFAVEADGG